MLRILLLAFLLCFGLSAETRADGFDDGLHLLGGKFDDVERGVVILAGSGDQRAGAVLAALQDNRLMVVAGDPPSFFIRQADDSLLDAATLQPAGDAAAGAKAVRVNNRIRRAAEAALGTLNLSSPNAAIRRQAADAVFKARDGEALPALEAALAKERDPDVKAVMETARAAIFLANGQGDEAQRLQAVETIGRRGDPDALAMLRNLANDTSASIREAAAASVSSIEMRQSMLARVQDAIYGISLGSVLLLAAIGLAITFGVMGVINMAHGEMVMLGAYTTYVVQTLFVTYLPDAANWSLIAAVPAAFVVGGLAGVILERTVIRFLYGRPLETLLATFGISLILQQAVRSIFGPTNREVTSPSWMSGSFDILDGLTLTSGRLVIIIFCLAVFLGLLAFIRYSRFGLEMRAVTQNRRMAASMGIRTGLVDALTFGLGSGIAGIAGVALSQIDNVSPNLGQGYIIDSFLVVVFGGVGNLWGTLTGAMAIGIANKLLEPFTGAVLGKIILLVLVILFIQKRPRGLFALKGRAIEA
ncbi:amino acid/amide ABC transporter membrane protein 1, HAAT family [Arboricoccus pini]|uniref:Amino acid/amide ABC transporter membrane protein 1, HAAT family n=1 Tax=Arboricoccus pini TaxID=1963835 RepID=A0A212RCI9_9PROT|nr:urea ABC transporter permease subunit UrtB [Arboricoccus pini]SNB69929.1 amino acid/amide ABC transporter membrane protein 1, HAAT family [Arboricoccus pini]